MMKTIDELVISPLPWCVGTGRIYTNVECDGDTVAVGVEEHDARLIAAAPDMYDALLRIVSAADDSVGGFPKWRENLNVALHDARKALAKASGEEV